MINLGGNEEMHLALPNFHHWRVLELLSGPKVKLFWEVPKGGLASVVRVFLEKTTVSKTIGKVNHCLFDFWKNIQNRSLQNNNVCSAAWLCPDSSGYIHNFILCLAVKAVTSHSWPPLTFSSFCRWSDQVCWQTVGEKESRTISLI